MKLCFAILLFACPALAQFPVLPGTNTVAVPVVTVTNAANLLREAASFMTMPKALVAPKVTAITLAWNKSPDASVTGYRIYYGPTTGNYTNSIAVGNVTNYTVPVIANVPYFFAATAYDKDGMESDFSNEAAGETGVTVGIRTYIWAVDTYGFAGKTNEVLCSTNMQAWDVIRTFVGTGIRTNILHTNTARAYFRVRQKGKP